jgi:FeS assembly SUF system regulator
MSLAKYFRVILGPQMIRISKLTDYGVMIMAFMAASPHCLFQAKEIADQTTISLPTVSKLLKILTKQNFLVSHRGTNGGYQLTLAANSISVADLIQALEGPIAITECNLNHDACPQEPNCGLRAPWQLINRTITNALSKVKLSDLVPDFMQSHDFQILQVKDTYANAIRN